MEENDELENCDGDRSNNTNDLNFVPSRKSSNVDVGSVYFDESSNSPDKKRPENRRLSSGTKSDNSKKRKYHRRKQGGARHCNNKRWRPYNQLSWLEKKELEDFESKRACLKREERFASGHPVAPYNTTQFLMEEHSKTENISPDIHNNSALGTHEQVVNNNGEGESITTSVDSLDDFYDSPNDEDSFIAKDFSETYDNLHAEHIETMSKANLVKDYMELEIKIEKLENKLKVYESLNIIEKKSTLFDIIEKKSTLFDMRQNSLLDPNVRPLMTDQKLKFENEKLKQDNNDLKRQIELLKSKHTDIL